MSLSVALLALPLLMPAQPGDVQLRLERGSLKGLEAGELFRMAVGSERRELDELAYLELREQGRARLRYGRTASVMIDGPAALSVVPAAGGTAARLSLHHVHHVELELRRGSLPVDLPVGHWTLELRRASVELRELVTGGLELVHRGGEPLALARLEGPHDVRRTLWLRPGSSLRLAADG